jgi:hypothetical protein
MPGWHENVAQTPALVRKKLERRFFHRSHLLAQGKNPILPVAYRAEPGEGHGKCGIRPAAGNPRGVMHVAQGSERFDQMEFADIEAPKGLVSLQDLGELPGLGVCVAR